jgi:hypothetical protein
MKPAKRRVMSMQRYILAAGSVLIAVVGFPLRSDAQRGAIRSGDRVRVTVHHQGAGSITGTVVELDSDRLILSVTGWQDTIEVALNSLKGCRLSMGMKSRTVQGALLGGALGLGAGGMIGLIFGGCDNSNPGEWCLEGEEWIAAAYLGAIGLAVGIGIGTLAGSTIKQEIWKDVSRELLGLRILPGKRDGLAVALSVNFH